MSTNIKSIRIVLPHTEDRGELDLTSTFDVPGGFGATVGFDGLTAEQHPETQYTKATWSLSDVPTLANPYPDGATISAEVALAVAREVREYLEENDGPMTHVEVFEPDGFTFVQVEDGGIDVAFVSFEYRDQVRFEAITNTLGLELTVELLDDVEEPAVDPRALVRIEGKIIRADGSSSEFSIGRDGYQQWGALRDVLGDSVGLVTALTEAARDYLPEED